MTDEKKFKLSDDLIAVVRELVQLALITGTNIVDHLRAVEVELDGQEKIVPTVVYIEAYNKMVEELVQKANDTQKKIDSASELDLGGIVTNSEENPN
jgi:hypothetical protein